jgi:AcrR family transcriptional regulator
MARADARQQLLDAAIDHVAAHGLHDLSMRSLAAELGTSHRMLSHHFGSKDGLWLAIVQEVERRQLAAIGELEAQLTASSPTASLPDASLPDAMRAWWRHIADPSLWPSERLFFEVYAQALRGREPASQLLDNVVESWLEPATRMAEAMGVAPEDARAFARLGLAVTRGLLLDLLATGDRAGVDAAMEQWIAVTPLRRST